ncbi:hypothetical protein F3Y22_tig00116979pilonHSYRG00011 [Hibiscus syriacus]|uniref:Uncharacterized protein n=1 Tax=Hibiscus syriacus TaxID=106335 RepID=A0A6A2WGG8_HIBSY|nr:hypothetical protein F3Y22_tig00116979pilonHSYRG00011 [Hibiscus syriacus]
MRALRRLRESYKSMDSGSCRSRLKRAYKFRYKRSLEEDSLLAPPEMGIISAYRYDGDEYDETWHILRPPFSIMNPWNGIPPRGSDPNREYKESSTTQCNIQRLQRHLWSFHHKACCNPLHSRPSKALCKGRASNLTVLRAAINTAGTDEDVLSREIVTRLEKELKEINELYLKRNNVSLDEAVGRDCSGDYKDFILTLLGADRS